MPPYTLPDHPDCLVESDRLVWEGRFPLQLVRFRNRRFDGTFSGPRTWELWRRGRAAAVLPYDPRTDQVVLIEQFRLPALAAGIDPVMVEIPAGLVEDGETPDATILREAEEESGLTVDRLERIGDFMLTPGGCDETCAIFAGAVHAPETGPDGLVGQAGLAEEDEDIRVRVVPADHAIERALAGAYPNSVATIALLWLALRRDWLRQHWSTR
jgi:ADP-ribose pyrophosphatase